MACDDAVCRIYAVYRNDRNALGIRAGVYAWKFRRLYLHCLQG